MWNRITERLRHAPDNYNILYLASDQDLDRKETLKRGFRKENLYIAEIDQAKANKLNKDGKNVLIGDVLDILDNDTSLVNFHIINLDLCSGLTRNGIDICSCAISKFPKSIFAFNFLRGRDQAAAGLSRTLDIMYGDNERILKLFKIDSIKHRGFQFFMNHLISECHGKLKNEYYGVDAAASTVLDQDIIYSYEYLIEVVDMIADTKPRFFSYKSKSGAMMDSVVFGGKHLRNSGSRIK
jgi:hypothetical protein